jgi:hypothetical protein
MNIEIIDINPYGPLSPNQLDDFEKRNFMHLPSDYRNFLLQNNGGRPVPSFFWIKPYEDGTGVYQFYGLHNGPPHLCIATYVNDERFGIPNLILPIGDDGIGNSLCLGVSSSNQGKIFFLDHEVYPYHISNSSLGLFKISDSFSEFLCSLMGNPE